MIFLQNTIRNIIALFHDRNIWLKDHCVRRVMPSSDPEGRFFLLKSLQNNGSFSCSPLNFTFQFVQKKPLEVSDYAEMRHFNIAMASLASHILIHPRVCYLSSYRYM